MPLKKKVKIKIRKQCLSFLINETNISIATEHIDFVYQKIPYFSTRKATMNPIKRKSRCKKER